VRDEQLQALDVVDDDLLDLATALSREVAQRQARQPLGHPQAEQQLERGTM